MLTPAQKKIRQEMEELQINGRLHRLESSVSPPELHTKPNTMREAQLERNPTNHPNHFRYDNRHLQELYERKYGTSHQLFNKNPII